MSAYHRNSINVTLVHVFILTNVLFPYCSHSSPFCTPSKSYTEGRYHPRTFYRKTTYYVNLLGLSPICGSDVTTFIDHLPKCFIFIYFFKVSLFNIGSTLGKQVRVRLTRLTGILSISPHTICTLNLSCP